MSGASRRRGARIQTQFETHFSGEAGAGSAILAEFSSSGARLRCPEPWPAVGLPIALYVWLPNQAEPSEITGSVVRHAGDGFAMEFEKPGQETCLLVDAAAQLVRDVGERANPAPSPAPGKRAAAPLPALGALALERYPLIDLEAHAGRVAQAIAKLRAARSR